jgi:hypothetical protein
MSDARKWLREELRDDRKAIAAKSPTDWLVTIVDIAVGPALALRAVLASWIWAINHGTSADVGLSLADPAIIAPAWGRVDAAQVAALLVVGPALFHELPLCCSAIPPGVAGYLWLQGLAVAVEGAAVVTGVRL